MNHTAERLINREILMDVIFPPLVEGGKQNTPHPENNRDGVTRVLLIDGCLTFRNGLEQEISKHQDLKVVGRVATAAQVFNANFQDPADVAVVDVDLLDQSGIELCQWLKIRYPEMSLLLLSDRDWDVYLLAAQVTFTAGLLVRRTPTHKIIQFLKQAKKGSLYSPEQLQRIEDWKNNIGSVLKSLRPREWQVLWQVTAGLSNREIAQNLKISENTIEKYMTGLFQKFGLASRSALMVYIYSSHLDVFNNLDDRLRVKLLAG